MLSLQGLLTILTTIVENYQFQKTAVLWNDGVELIISSLSLSKTGMKSHDTKLPAVLQHEASLFTVFFAFFLPEDSLPLKRYFWKRTFMFKSYSQFLT